MLSFTQSRNGHGDLISAYEATMHIGGRVKLVSLVSMNPNHPDVADPGMWSATISTVDGGLISMGLFDDKLSAISAAQLGWAKKWYYDQWIRFFKGNNLDRISGNELYMKLLALLV